MQYWLEKHEIPATDELVDRIFQRAKESDRMLTDEEIMETVTAANGVKAELAS